jgi:predicted metal-dependent enzyme (double-stranded beta helix superfamily)
MNQLQPLREFVVEMTKAVSSQLTEAKLLLVCEKLLKSLIATSDWLPAEYAKHDSDHYCQHLLHCDPLERFSVVSFVWGAGQHTPIHNHQTWGMVGVLSGIEKSTLFNRDNKTGALIQGDTLTLKAGEIDQFSPEIGDIHEARNALPDQKSISIHIYGANIGIIKRQIFNKKTGTPTEFVSGYSSENIPNLWDY